MKEISATFPTITAETAAASTARKNRFSVARTAGAMPVYRPENVIAHYANADTTAVPSTGFGTSAPGFKDLVDVVNPLQHIPVVSTLYRNVTGDEISSVARVIGGTVFGGPIGGALALADVAIKEQTGTTVGEKALNLVSSNKENSTEVETATYTLGKRSLETPRMAGTIPVWHTPASAGTRFDTMLAGISDDNNHIS